MNIKRGYTFFGILALILIVLIAIYKFRAQNFTNPTPSVFHGLNLETKSLGELPSVFV